MSRVLASKHNPIFFFTWTHQITAQERQVLAKPGLSKCMVQTVK